MKKIERYVCIFCVVTGFIAAYVIGYNLGYDSDDSALKMQTENEQSNISKETDSEKNDTDEVTENEDFLKETATLIIEKCMDGSEEITSSQKNLPVEMIGFDRNETIEYLEKHSDSFEDAGEDITGLWLVSFSSDKVVVRKNVTEEQVMIYSNSDSERYNYYISFKDNTVVVFKKDKETVFIETGISYDMVDRETRENIEQGVWIENISVLYRYLESITS